MTTGETVSKPAAAPASYSLWDITAYMLRLGAVGFGGPVALVGYMHRDLVERRQWFSEADYKEGLTLAQLMPGPLAAQLAIYLGFVRYGVLGATLAGLAFVLPSFLMVLALGWAYVSYGGLQWMQSVFYGVGAAVIGIIAVSAYKLTSRTIGRNWLLWVIYLASAIVTVLRQTEYILLFLGAGLLYWLYQRRPKWQRPMGFHSTALLIAPLLAAASDTAGDRSLLAILKVFGKAGAFVFGSGLAIVPFLRSSTVNEYRWLNDQQFLDAVAVAMITPGPVVITTGFIGYLVRGFSGACVAALATFLPCYFLTIFPAPYFKRHGKHPGIVAFVDGVTAAAIGAIAGAVIVLARRTMVDHQTLHTSIPQWLILLITVGLLLRFKKVPEPLVVLGAAAAGLVIYPLIH